MHMLRDILSAWGDLWRYPGVVSLLDRGQEPAPAEIVLALMDGLAVPRDQQAAFAALLRLGEFRAAEALLEDEAFRAAVTGSGANAPEQKLAAARRRAREELQAHLTGLEERARRTGSGPAPPAGIDRALEVSRVQAEDLITRWEDEIRAAEEQTRQQLRVQLEAEGASADTLAWGEAVERCLEAGEFEAARALLGGGPSAAMEGPLGTPRRPPWPWDEEPTAEVLGWFEGKLAVPQAFLARWRHDAHDGEAAALVQALKDVVAKGSTAATVSTLAAALEAFLGQSPPPAREVTEHAGGVETRLHGLADARLPFLGVAGDSGVRFWVCGLPDAEPPPDGPGVIVCFTTGPAPPPRRGAVWLDPRSLFRLLGDSRASRRTNFLRELGARVDLRDAVPPGSDTLPLPSGNAAGLRAYVHWLFDLLSVEVDGPALTDVLIFRAGTHAGVLLRLVQSLLEGAAGRRAPITLEDVSRVWQSETFRESARQALLAPLLGELRVQAVLGAAFLAGLTPGGELTDEETLFFLEDVQGGAFAEPEVGDGLRRLAAAGLLEAVEGRQYRIPLSGVGFLLLDVLGDLEGFVRTALGKDGGRAP
jgi:hypothetical protein